MYFDPIKRQSSIFVIHISCDNIPQYITAKDPDYDEPYVLTTKLVLLATPMLSERKKSVCYNPKHFYRTTRWKLRYC